MEQQQRPQSHSSVQSRPGGASEHQGPLFEMSSRSAVSNDNVPSSVSMGISSNGGSGERDRDGRGSVKSSTASHNIPVSTTTLVNEPSLDAHRSADTVTVDHGYHDLQLR